MKKRRDNEVSNAMTTAPRAGQTPAAANPDEARDKMLAALGALEGALRHRVPATHVLVYGGHLVPGIYVLAAGAVNLEALHAEGSPTRVAVTPGRLIVMPPHEEIGQPSGVTVTAQTDLDVLFVPRTTVLAPGFAGALLADPVLETCPLSGVSAGTKT